jgi:hypothetical protein
VVGALLGLAVLAAAPMAAVPAARFAAHLIGAQAGEPLVRHLGAHRAYGRTEVRVVGTGWRGYRLSEPFRVHGRWRLYLTLDDARLSLYAPRSPRAMGVVSKLAAEQRRGGVRIMVEASALGPYGFRAAGDTLVVWLGD